MTRLLLILLVATCAFAQRSLFWAQNITTDSAAPPNTFSHYIAIPTVAGQEGTADSSNYPVCFNTGNSGGCTHLNIASYFATTAHGGYVTNTVSQTGSPYTGAQPADAVVTTRDRKSVV